MKVRSLTFLITTFLLIMISNNTSAQENFKTTQLKYKRVKDAYNEKGDTMKKLLEAKGVKDLKYEMFIQAFKSERIVEIWVKPDGKSSYIHLIDYKFCSFSGSLGPKRKQGDGQIPEGVYYIKHFNPFSNFHLSLGINYPNESDSKLGVKGNLGDNIYIHGNCVTIGCIPITDDKIKELYILAVDAKSNGQSKIPVYIFPYKMTESNIKKFEKENSKDTKKTEFWNNLKPIYDYFESNKKIPKISVGSDGKYKVN